MDLLNKIHFQVLQQKLIYMGYGGEIDWQRNLQECDNYVTFIDEAIWVILNSGMKEQIARQISNRIKAALIEGRDISEVFGHKGKVAAIKLLLHKGHELFAEYCKSENKIEYLKTIPFIGNITCYHLAKNLGHDCVKPDRHLVRVANKYNLTPDELCETISKETGEKKCVIDIIIWRACNLQLL